MVDIQGYEGLYKIDESGNVYSLPRKGTKGGLIGHIKEEYIEVALSKNRKLKRFALHRLLANAFIKKVDGLDMVNHIDGDKYNNALTNLEWTNNSMNIKHAYQNGLIIKKNGHKNGMSKLSEKQVFEIREISRNRGKHYNRKELAKMYSVSESTIKDVVNNKSYVY